MSASSCRQLVSAVSSKPSNSVAQQPFFPAAHLTNPRRTPNVRRRNALLGKTAFAGHDPCCCSYCSCHCNTASHCTSLMRASPRRAPQQRSLLTLIRLGKEGRVRVKEWEVGAMRTAAVFCRNLRRLSSMASQGSIGLVARPAVKSALSRVGRMDSSRNLFLSPAWGVESRGAGGTLAQSGATSRFGALRFAGFETFKEEHAIASVPDENEDEMKNNEHPEEIIEKASQELFRQSNVIGDPEEVEVEEFQVKDLGEKPGADIAREVWSAKEQDGTNVFSDNSDKVQSGA